MWKSSKRNGRDMPRPFNKIKPKKLLLHCAHDEASDRRQNAAANATGKNLADDAGNIKTAACGSAEERANDAAKRRVAADAANGARDQLRQHRHASRFHQIAHNAAAGSAGYGLNDERNNGFHMFKSRFVTPNDFPSQAK
jgi:hypothetical protein